MIFFFRHRRYVLKELHWDHVGVSINDRGATFWQNTHETGNKSKRIRKYMEGKGSENQHCCTILT